MKKILFLLSLVFAFSNTSHASHFMGGEITVTHITGNDYLVVLTAFRDMNGVNFTQTAQTLTAYDSSGNSSPILMSYHANSVHPLYGFQTFTQIPNMTYPVEMDMWYDTVTIPTGTKYLTWGTCCRNSSILNGVADLNFSLVAEVTISSINNSSPVFLTPPVMIVPENVPWQYNPLPYDADGDSLVWSFDAPFGDALVFPPPSLVITTPPSDPNNVLRIDSITGQIDWTASQQGNYVMMVKCEEFRNGVKIGEINRDMQYIVIPDSLVVAPTVSNMSSIPTNSSGYPYIVSQPNQNISFSLMVDNSANNVSMEAFGEPLLLDNNMATFTNLVSGNNIEGMFSWSPSQNEARVNPYLVVIRSTNGSYSLDETIQIEVSSITGLNEVKLEESKIFPNPTMDEFYIEFDLDKSAEISVVVYDLLGKKVKIFLTKKGVGKHLLKSDFNLENGQYIISIKKDNVEFKSEKLIINN